MLQGKPIKAAVIGPANLVERVASSAREMDDRIVVEFYSYEEEEQILDLYRQASAKNEVVLFTGPLAYFRVQGAFPNWVVPSTYVPYSPDWLYPPLLRLLSRGYDIRKASVDGFGRDAINEVYAEIGFDSRGVLSWTETSDEEELYRLHRQAYESGQACCIVTCIRNIYGKLLRHNIPVEWAVPTNSALRELLKKGILLGEAAREAERQVAVGILEFDDPRQEEELGIPYEYRRERLILAVHQILLGQFERLGAFVTPTRPGSFLFIATRGSLKDFTHSFRSFDLLDILKRKTGVAASVGIGFGSTPWDAGRMAYKALQMARRGGGNCCYLLSEGGELWGPLGSSQALKIDIRVTANQALFRLAEKAGCSPPTLSRVIAALCSLDKSFFTSEDLARLTGVSTRSAQRMLKRLLEAGVVKRAGVEKIISPGRNRSLYTFSREEKEVREVLEG
ncbi:hypothetical protein [Thermanaeromonas sp. C210]|uniref:hypothetical protein n=1 Tax=Thermanaeromonas sp. C210 TaxID=2731925 RepID=UPI00155CC474|nr:hypothetical protein [Thermanaeromonas sp. C210]GFN22331.1 hypothetical protein TAMC210_06470 [Thermanaeromonas sp. C210]